MNPPVQTPPQAMVFWIIWFAIFSGLMILQFILGGGFPAGRSQGDEPVVFLIIALSLATASLGVRFVWIPRTNGLVRKLPLMIVGLALAEAIGILGMLLVPEQHVASRMFMLCTAIVCIVLSAPVYAHRQRTGSPFRVEPTDGA
jgi:hypothetical protein